MQNGFGDARQAHGDAVISSTFAFDDGIGGIAYVGMDNRNAGQTAAYLLSRWLGTEAQEVAVVISSERFRGEEEREMGFRMWLRGRAPHLRVLDISEGLGVYEPTFARVTLALEQHPRLQAVYSVGGGNTAQVGIDTQTGEWLPATVAIYHGGTAQRAAVRCECRIVLHHDGIRA